MASATRAPRRTAEGHDLREGVHQPAAARARTCELAGFGAGAETDPDLVEWDYGKYEGLTSAQILASTPGLATVSGRRPGGESPAQIGERADRVVQRLRAIGGDVLLFSSGHFIRVLTARWLGLGAGTGGQIFSARAGEPERAEL